MPPDQSVHALGHRCTPPTKRGDDEVFGLPLVELYIVSVLVLRKEVLDSPFRQDKTDFIELPNSVAILQVACYYLIQILTYRRHIVREQGVEKYTIPHLPNPRARWVYTPPPHHSIQRVHSRILPPEYRTAEMKKRPGRPDVG